MKKSVIHLKSILVALAGIGMATLPIISFANPTGGNVVAGNVTIQQESATKLGITQTSDKAIIDWQKYSIGANEHVQYYQPSASSVNLNRVVGQDPSQILGRLTANGQVFLVNPNGIFFGRNAQIDVAGLVASTHNIRNEDFLAGRYTFNIPGKPGASVINEGTIRIADTGIGAFVAPSVANRGVIVARLGKVMLAAANGFTLDFHGDELLTFLVGDDVATTAFDVDGKQLTSFVENAGQIEAQGGYVLLTAKAAEKAVHSVINQSGSIEATSVGQQNGEIVLAGGQYGTVSNTGTLDASGKVEGETGGVVQITGESIDLSSGTQIDVSGDQGGGKAIVGGDYLGGKADDATMALFGIQRESHFVQTATSTYMARDALIEANAISRGKGGKVVLWSDYDTRAYGSISAKGGALGGDGGFIETSGEHLDFVGLRANASAPNGKSGSWLLDPANLTIDSAAAAGIEAALNSGTNSLVSATDMVDITANITKSSGGDATFDVRSAWIYHHEGANLTSGSGKLHVNYIATDRVWIGRGWVGGESNFATNGGNITFHGPNFVGVNGVIDAGAGKILIKAENKNATGIDKGIWVFGATILRGGSVSLVTGDTLRQDAEAKVIRGIVEGNTLGRLEALGKTLDILNKLGEEIDEYKPMVLDLELDVIETASTDMRTISGVVLSRDAQKSVVSAARSLTGLSKSQAESISKVAGSIDLVLKVIKLSADAIDIAQANNIGAIAGATNVLFNDLAIMAGTAAGAKLGSLAGTSAGLFFSPLGGLIGGVVGGIATGASGGVVADNVYDKFLAKYVVEISADIARDKLRRSTGNVLGI